MRRSGLFLLTIVAIVSVATTSSQAQSVLTHHVREAIRNGQAQSLGQLPADQIMNLDIVLPLRDQAGLDSISEGTLRSGQPLLPAFPHRAGVHRTVWSQPGRL